MNNLIIWILLFIPSLLVEIACYFLAPLVALFIRTELREDRVKRLDNQVLTMPRDYLIKPLMWFQTHDNAVDEWWYGLFNSDSYFRFLREATQADYDSSAWIRYCCRVHWLWRNCAYGFLYHLFGRVYEQTGTAYGHGTKNKGFWYLLMVYQSSFQLEAQIPLYGKRHISINVGWKHHDTFQRVMYANRIIGFRKYKG